MSAPSSDSAAIRQTIRALRAAGWELDSVWDGEESTPVTNEKEALEAITAVDEAWLYVKLDNHNPGVFFVMGNEPYEVINDYSVSLSEVIDPMTDKWWESV